MTDISKINLYGTEYEIADQKARAEIEELKQTINKLNNAVSALQKKV